MLRMGPNRKWRTFRHLTASSSAVRYEQRLQATICSCEAWNLWNLSVRGWRNDQQNWHLLWRFWRTHSNVRVYEQQSSDDPLWRCFRWTKTLTIATKALDWWQNELFHKILKFYLIEDNFPYLQLALTVLKQEYFSLEFTRTLHIILLGFWTTWLEL